MRPDSGSGTGSDGAGGEGAGGEAEERGLSPAYRARMRELAADYARALPGRDTASLTAGLGARLIYMDMGGRDGAYDPEHDVILINSAVSPARQRFTLAHEISHALLLGDDDLLSELHDSFEGDRLEHAIETLCNLGAAAILLPDELIADVLERYGATGRALAELSRRADVSASSALYALAEAAPGAVLFAICARVGQGARGKASGAGDGQPARRGRARPVVVRSSAGTAGSRYSLRPGIPIPEDHPLVMALDTGLEQEGMSYIPFRSGRRMPAWMDAYPDGRAVLVSFRQEI